MQQSCGFWLFCQFWHSRPPVPKSRSRQPLGPDKRTPAQTQPGRFSMRCASRLVQISLARHRLENLSVKLLGDPTQTCSIVFVTPADPAAAFARMERVINTINPTDDSTVTVNASRTADGKNILNARINAQ